MIMMEVPGAADMSFAATSVPASLTAVLFFFFPQPLPLTPTAYDGTIMIISKLSAAMIGLDTLSPSELSHIALVLFIITPGTKIKPGTYLRATFHVRKSGRFTSLIKLQHLSV